MTPIFHSTGIVGTGAMGRGIAQIAAQTGSMVYLFDTQAGAAAAAQTAVFAQWDKLLEKGRLTEVLTAELKTRLRCADALTGLSDCNLVVEAIVERLDAKAGLFAQLESIVGASAISLFQSGALDEGG
jgi:3-hydroxybutyryl-CoA dehydrogenase